VTGSPSCWTGWTAPEAAQLEHADLEDQLETTGRDLLRQLLQDRLDLHVRQEVRVEVVDAAGSRHPAVEGGHQRGLSTVFGQVEVTRLAYRRRGHRNLHPAGALLNLPTEKHSHGLRRLAAIESARSSFDGAAAAMGRCTGQAMGKRQVEQLAARAAVDFDDYYADRPPRRPEPGAVLILSCDGKGIVMRPDALRTATAKAAAAGNTKLATRLSKGEKRNRKRMAEVASVLAVQTMSVRVTSPRMTRSDFGLATGCCSESRARLSASHQASRAALMQAAMRPGRGRKRGLQPRVQGGSRCPWRTLRRLRVS